MKEYCSDLAKAQDQVSFLYGKWEFLENKKHGSALKKLKWRCRWKG